MSSPSQKEKGRGRPNTRAYAASAAAAEAVQQKPTVTSSKKKKKQKKQQRARSKTVGSSKKKKTATTKQQQAAVKSIMVHMTIVEPSDDLMYAGGPGAEFFTVESDAHQTPYKQGDTFQVATDDSVVAWMRTEIGEEDLVASGGTIDRKSEKLTNSDREYGRFYEGLIGRTYTVKRMLAKPGEPNLGDDTFGLEDDGPCYHWQKGKAVLLKLIPQGQPGGPSLFQEDMVLLTCEKDTSSPNTWQISAATCVD